MRTSPRANMRGDVLSSQPARLARKGRCQGAAVRATRETSRRGSHDKARPGREDTFHQRRRRRRKRQDAKSKNTGKAHKAPALRRAPRCDAHLPRKAAKKETPRREKQGHGKSPQSAPRRVPDAKGKVTGAATTTRAPDANAHSSRKAAKGWTPGRERQGHGAAHKASFTTRQDAKSKDAGKARKAPALRRAPGTKGKAMERQSRKSAPWRACGRCRPESPCVPPARHA